MSQVFVGPDAVLRGLRTAGADDYAALEGAAFFSELQADGRLVGTRRAADPSALAGDWAAVLQHERVPVVSYPYEWTFSMLQDAALLQVDVTRRAVAEGLITKDASAYNVQFVGSRPTFIDIGSFERLRPGEPWAGYRQLCQHFLNPLVLQALTGTEFQPWLRGSLDGIAPSALAPLVKGRRRFDRRLLVHLRLHARAERRYASSTGNVGGELRQAGFGPKVLLAQLDNLERTIRSLRWSAGDSTWSGYADRAHYGDADLAAKERLVGTAVRTARPSLVLDLGANDGHFSRLARAEGAERVVAVDGDQLVVDRLYQALRAEGDDRILPLLGDLTDPSPGRGWAGRERAPFAQRVRPDLLLCLAVVHHLAISSTVPFPLIVDQLAAPGCPVVVELPHPDDPMVQVLLGRKRRGLFDHYTVASWEAELARRFIVDDQETLPSGTRTVYRGRPR